MEKAINTMKLPEIDEFDDVSDIADVDNIYDINDFEEKDEKPKFSFHLKKYIDSKKNNHTIKKLQKKTDEILSFREQMRDVEDLSMIRTSLQKRLDHGETLDDILPEAFAAVIEAVSRVKPGIELTPSQIMTSLVLNDGNVAELATGEGKTFALTMAAYLNSFNGNQVHVFTANDYLAQRDSETNTPVFETLGLKVGCALDHYSVDGEILSKGDSKKLRREAYKNLDIIYAKSSTVAFDWEEDQQVMKEEDIMLSRPFGYAIVDEVDSVMIDDANTPLVISSSLENFEKKMKSNEKDNKDGGIYGEDNRNRMVALANYIVKSLRENPRNTFRNAKGTSSSPLYNMISIGGKHIEGTKNALYDKIKDSGAKIFVDERNKTVELTDLGYKEIGHLIEKLPFDENEFFHYIQNALQAHCILQENVDYRIAINPKTGSDRIILIDANTGRDLPDNKFSEGLHQALEEKENISQNEKTSMSISTAKITHPSFFAKYEKIGGTSGTVSDEITKSEFREQYKKKIIEIPRFRKKIAIEQPTEVYATRQEKMDAIINQIVECHKKEQPILIGARDIDEAKEIMENLEPYAQKPFDQVCCDIFNTSKDRINIIKATKLYCLMTNTEFPKHNRKALNVLCVKVESMLLPPNEMTKLDYRVQRILQKKIHDINHIPYENKEEIFKLANNREPRNQEEVQDLYIRASGIKYQSLTAEDTDREVEIVSQAGRLGAVTISTAIAGRGTDIALGGDPIELAKSDIERNYLKRVEGIANNAVREKEKAKIKRQAELLSRTGKCDNLEMQQLFEKKKEYWQNVCREEKELLEPNLFDPQGNKMHEAGKGLFVLGASLNDSIRVDNQLRGRAGRQGSDGESKFICSLEDPLMKQKGNQKELSKIRKLVKNNPYSEKAVRYVRAAQRSMESAHASNRTDTNRSAAGFDWVANAYYEYRENLLKNPEFAISGILESTSTLLFENKDGLELDGVLSHFVPQVFTEEEIHSLSNSELKDKFDEYVSKMMINAQNIPSENFMDQLKTTLLSKGDLKFSLLADSNEAEKRLFLAQLTPNNSTDPEVLLDQIIFEQYQYFRADVMVEASVTALQTIESYLKKNATDKNQDADLKKDLRNFSWSNDDLDAFNLIDDITSAGQDYMDDGEYQSGRSR